MLLPLVCGVSLCCASSAPAVARGWQQTTTILNQCGTWARGFPTTPLQTPLHMSALRGGTHAAPWKPRASAGAHRSHRAYGRSCSRRAHHLRRWQKNVEAVAGWQIRMPSSMGTRAASLRHDAHQGDDNTGFATNLPQEVADTLRVHGIIRPRDSVLVCVSGGVDSVALLHILADLREEWVLDLHVLHFNHGKRAESDEEESFVRDLGARLGVDVHVRHPASPFEAVGFQAKARTWRRAEAQELMRLLGAQVILQGHHADDQTETILLKILRGCHLSHIAGMAYREGSFGRPLLDIPKERLRSFLTSRSATWREDASNADSDFLRNRVRAELVPLLGELTNGSLEARLQSLTTQSKQLRTWLDDHPTARVRNSAQVIADGGDGGGGGVWGNDEVVERHTVKDHRETNWDTSAPRYLDNGELDLSAWRQLPGMVQEDQLYEYILSSSGVRLRYHNLRKLWKHMQTDNLSWDWQLGKEWNLVRAGQRVWMQQKRVQARKGQATARTPASDTDEEGGDEEEVQLHIERGVVISHPRGWTVRAFWEHGKAAGAYEGVRLTNLPEACALQLRLRQPQDRFRHHDRTDGKAVLLKDWMRHRAFPLHARDRTPLVCVGGEVVAVYPGALAKAVAPADGDSNGDGMFLRVVIDRVML